MLGSVVDRQREEQLLKKLKDYASGFYYDCTRYGLIDMIHSICSNVNESVDYDKFSSAIANVLFKKIYIDGECFKPQLITGIIDIVLEILNVEEVKVGFAPASAMLGECKSSSFDIRLKIIEQFNKNVDSFDDDEVKEFRIVENK